MFGNLYLKIYTIRIIIISMFPSKFNYYAPQTIEDALNLLEKYADEAKILAGGQSLTILMKFRLVRPGYIIDINRIKSLEYIRKEGNELKIGALTRISDILESELINKEYPIIIDAAKTIADPLVRNLATIGGNICHGDPGNDLPAVMMVLNARYKIQSLNGVRYVQASEFNIDSFTVDLKPNEMLTEIIIPNLDNFSGASYIKVKRKDGDFAAAAVASYLSIDQNDKIKDVRIGLTSLGSKPFLVKIDVNFIGSKASDDVFKQISMISYESANPVSDIRASAEFKKKLAKFLTFLSLKLSLSRIKGF